MKAAALILALAASSAQAQFVDGNELYERMITTGPKLLNAQGYIMGVADAALGTEWCPPPTVTMRQVFDMIRAINREKKTTILLIEHDVKLVMGLCDRITVLDYGKVIADGTADAVKKDPAVIAAYLGKEAA